MAARDAAIRVPDAPAGGAARRRLESAIKETV